MFNNLYNIFDNAARLDESEAFRLAVNDEVKKLIVHLNTVIQLGESGIDSEGDNLGVYAPFTIQERSDLGLQVNHVDFKVTGDYWGSWSVEVKGDEIIISVNTERFNELTQDLNFSKTHVGLTDENIAILAAKMLITYQDYARNKLFS